MKTILFGKKNHAVIVDDQDEQLLRSYPWWCEKIGRTWYVIRRDPETKKKFYLHRAILSPEKGELVDHVNGNGLDNRRENIRICSRAQNAMNLIRSVYHSSGFKGVYMPTGYSKWVVRIGVSVGANRKGIHVGVFDCEIEAAIAYDKAARKYHKEFAKLNFPYGIA